MAKLILKFNNEILEQYEIKQGDMTIGRRPGNDVQIDNLAVSGNHASVFTIGEDSFIQDLDSTNGTFINNKKLTKHHLMNGDVVVIGKHSLTYVNEKQAKPADDFAKTVILKAAPKVEARPAALFFLSGSNNGKRVDLVKDVTNLGSMGKPAGTITRKGDQYVLAAVAGGETPKLNGRPVSAVGDILKNGDVIEVGDSRLQFHFK